MHLRDGLASQAASGWPAAGASRFAKKHPRAADELSVMKTMLGTPGGLPGCCDELASTATSLSTRVALVLAQRAWLAAALGSGAASHQRRQPASHLPLSPCHPFAQSTWHQR